MARVVEGDTLNIAEFTIRDDGKPVDLSGATVRIKYRIEKDAPKDLGPLTIVTPATNGKCRWKWEPGNLDRAGLLVGRINITSAGGTGKSYRFVIHVEKE